MKHWFWNLLCAFPHFLSLGLFFVSGLLTRKIPLHFPLLPFPITHRDGRPEPQNCNGRLVWFPVSVIPQSRVIPHRLRQRAEELVRFGTMIPGFRRTKLDPRQNKNVVPKVPPSPGGPAYWEKQSELKRWAGMVEPVRSGKWRYQACSKGGSWAEFKLMLKEIQARWCTPSECSKEVGDLDL